MESLYLLIPIVLIMVIAAVGVLFWAINSGQYDDLEKESRRILLDDDWVDDKRSEEESSDTVGNGDTKNKHQNDDS